MTPFFVWAANIGRASVNIVAVWCVPWRGPYARPVSVLGADTPRDAK